MDYAQLKMLEELFTVFLQEKADAPRKLSIKEMLQYAWVLEQIKLQLNGEN